MGDQGVTVGVTRKVVEKVIKERELGVCWERDNDLISVTSGHFLYTTVRLITVKSLKYSENTEDRIDVWMDIKINKTWVQSRREKFLKL